MASQNRWNLPQIESELPPLIQVRLLASSQRYSQRSRNLQRARESTSAPLRLLWVQCAAVMGALCLLHRVSRSRSRGPLLDIRRGHSAQAKCYPVSDRDGQYLADELRERQ